METQETDVGMFKSLRLKGCGPVGVALDTHGHDHVRLISRLRRPKSHVVVLLALHNGKNCLPDQLYSLKSQTHRDWSLIVSDDASTDAGADLVRCFARAEKHHKVVLISGPDRGFAANFMHLVRRAEPNSPFVAFSDQDDAWLPEKLEHGLKKLACIPAGKPAIYCGRTWVCGPNLRKLHPSPNFHKPPGFSNAIVQSIGGGNTMIMNGAALRLIQIASHKVDRVISHDWWAYQVVSGAGGTVIYDEEPMVLYRQHDDNVIGAANSVWATLRRLGMVLSGDFKKWNDTNMRALDACRHVLTPENRQILDAFSLAKAAPFFIRARIIRRIGVRHQTRLGNAGLWLATVLNRI